MRLFRSPLSNKRFNKPTWFKHEVGGLFVIIKTRRINQLPRVTALNTIDFQKKKKKKKQCNRTASRRV